MRIFIAVLILSTLPISAQADGKITDKPSCLSQLQRAITLSKAHASEDQPSVVGNQMNVLSDVQDREKAEIILDAYREIGRQYQIISDTMFSLCADYD